MANYKPQKGIARKQLKAVDLVRTANWLRAHDRMLVEERYTTERAIAKVNEELKLNMTESNLRTARRCVPDMRWRPYVDHSSQRKDGSQIRTSSPAILCMGAELEKLLTFMEMEVPHRIRLLSEAYQKFLDSTPNELNNGEVE